LSDEIYFLEVKDKNKSFRKKLIKKR